MTRVVQRAVEFTYRVHRKVKQGVMTRVVQRAVEFTYRVHRKVKQ